MAKLFSKKYKYELSPNQVSFCTKTIKFNTFLYLNTIFQEAFAYGVGNMVTSLFKGFPACVALSRSAILDGVGGKTQVLYIFEYNFQPSLYIA